MIIRLKGADFKDNNIGTLTTVSVLTDLGKGATYNGVSSAEKDKPFTATITLAENYEVGSAGVTVTMGGQPLSGAVTISGNTITINIASVTGTIKITVPTVNTSTGEEGGGDVNEPEVPDTPVEPTDELQGTWYMNETISIAKGSSFGGNSIGITNYKGYTVNYTTNGTDYDTIATNTAVGGLFYVTPGTTSAAFMYNAETNTWNKAAYRTLVITSKLSEVENGSTLLAWLKENGTKQ